MVLVLAFWYRIFNLANGKRFIVFKQTSTFFVNSLRFGVRRDSNVCHKAYGDNVRAMESQAAIKYYSQTKDFSAETTGSLLKLSSDNVSSRFRFQLVSYYSTPLQLSHLVQLASRPVTPPIAVAQLVLCCSIWNTECQMGSIVSGSLL